jgi:hypothetical protein
MNYKWGRANANAVCCLGWRPWYVLSKVYRNWWEDDTVRIYVIYKRILVGWMSENWTIKDVVALAKGLCDFAWGRPWLGEAGRAPFSSIPWHLPYNWGKVRKTEERAREKALPRTVEANRKLYGEGETLYFWGGGVKHLVRRPAGSARSSSW